MAAPLVSTAWLAARLDDDRVRVADVRWYLDEPERGRAEYGRSHIPGAVYVDLEADLSAAEGPGRHPLAAWDDFAAAMSRLGFGSEHHVVAYDDRGGAVAARLWWMLRTAGHLEVSVLDGGLTAWRAESRPETDLVPDRRPADFVARPRPGLTVERNAVGALLGEAVLLDARAPNRYRGEVEPIDPVAGHIPTAVNAPCEDNLGPDQRFHPPAELAARYRSLGVGAGRPVVAYCGSGVTACHDLLALEVAGLGEARLYPGSWSDWSAHEEQVATGPEPGRLT